jgi:spore germination cell wall hydrolase CwlJ-like protein
MNWLIIVFLLVSSSNLYASDLTKIRMVNAIIGEAEGEGYEGMLAVACAIRNRGTLNGVYGEKSRRMLEHQYRAKTFVLAVRAYEESAKRDIVDGADVWGTKSDVEIFKKTEWFKKYKLVKHIGNHYFYKRR